METGGVGFCQRKIDSDLYPELWHLKELPSTIASQTHKTKTQGPHAASSDIPVASRSKLGDGVDSAGSQEKQQ